MVTRRGTFGSLVVALLVAGCSPTESMPQWAGIVVTADPPVAERDIDLAILTLPEEERLRTTTIPAGTIVRWDEGLSSGPIRVVGPDEACTLDVDLPPERSTDVVLTQLDDGCSLRVVGPDESRPPAGNSGTVTANVTVKPWEGLLVEAMSLEDPRQPVPEPIPPDEGGLAILDPLHPGRYDIVLRRGDDVLETQRVTILDRGPAGHFLSLEFDGVPD